MDIGKLWQEAGKKGHKRDYSKVENAGDLCPSCRRNQRVHCPHKPILTIKSELSAQLSKEEVFGPSPPNVFVGHYGYPQVLWGPMVSLAENIPDNPREWYGWDFGKIVRARSMQIRAQKQFHIFEPSKSPGFGRKGQIPNMVLQVQEAAMSTKSVDMEVSFTRKPTLHLEFNSISQPMGASAPMKKLRVTDNAKIPKKVDRLVDEGVSAQEAVSTLFSTGFDEYYLAKLLSTGILGKAERKKFVPTRWSITATDDMIARQLMEKIRTMRQISKITVYSNEYLANKFDILLLPGAWEYENFEAWIGPSGTYAISQEHEPFSGRKGYARKQGGGYYAARLAVCEALSKKLKRQARAVVFREILPEYDLPVGVWEIRENVRHAFESKPMKFQSIAQALEYLSTSRLKLPLSRFLEKSEVLRQSRISDF